MKKIDIVALAGAALFTSLAIVGLVLGRDWKLLLVPLVLLPPIRLFGVGLTSKDTSPRLVPASLVLAVREIILALSVTAGTFGFTGIFTNGNCALSVGAMTAAISAISTIRLFSGAFRHRLLFIFCMLGAASYYVIADFVTSGNIDAMGFGALFVFPVFVVARAWLGVRDWKKGVAA